MVLESLFIYVFVKAFLEGFRMKTKKEAKAQGIIA